MTLTCPYCNYSWEPRVPSPKECPKCKRYFQLEPVIRVPKKEEVQP